MQTANVRLFMLRTATARCALLGSTPLLLADAPSPFLWTAWNRQDDNCSRSGEVLVWVRSVLVLPDRCHTNWPGCLT